MKALYKERALLGAFSNYLLCIHQSINVMHSVEEPHCPMSGISPVCGCLQSPLWYICILCLNHLLLTLNRWLNIYVSNYLTEL